jgi:4-cresol dehydrogenase (hydroxylating)
MVAVINLLFDRRDAEQQARAQRCADEMNEHLRRAGLEVYRAHVDMMAGIVARDREHWRIVRSLKLGLDPDNIIAPGRYNLPG